MSKMLTLAQSLDLSIPAFQQVGLWSHFSMLVKPASKKKDLVEYHLKVKMKY